VLFWIEKHGSFAISRRFNGKMNYMQLGGSLRLCSHPHVFVGRLRDCSVGEHRANAKRIL